jgi:hypothetical protein
MVVTGTELVILVVVLFMIGILLVVLEETDTEVLETLLYIELGVEDEVG